jgi:O-antigen/teichoic acid export membrane protein
LSSLALSDTATTQSSRGTALRNMAWLLGDKGLALIVGLGIQGLIARSLGPEGSGHFAFASAMLQTGLGLSLACAGVALLPRFCRMNQALPGALANVFVLRLVSSTLAALVMIAYCFWAEENPVRREVSIVMLAAIPLIEPFYVFATYWQSRNHNRPTVIARSSGLIVRAALVVAAVVMGAPVWVIAASWLIESAINAAIQTFQIRSQFGGRMRARVRATRVSRYLRFGMRFMLALWLAQLFLRLDRLVLANHLNAHDFGIYAASMQLVEVWTQVAYLIGSSIATAFLYKHLRTGEIVRSFAITAAAMLGIGLCGLLGAWALGPIVLKLVYGPAFAGSLPFLIAGSAMAAMLFVDQAVDMLIMGLNRPRLLVLKWGLAVSGAALAFALGFARWGAFIGPLGLACGVLAGWTGLLVFRMLSAEPWSPPR